MSGSTVTRRRRVAEGKCAVCLRRKRRSGYATCQPCGAAVIAYGAALYETRRAAGLCTLSSCGQPAVGYLCEGCAEARRARRRAS
jgi:hypothetical protein